jgi:mRNA-decapping enzyme subunit 2
MRIFQHCPLMSQWSHYHHMTAFSEFLAYKTRVPVRGAILLNESMDEVVLVKGWKKGANWSFPRGKINKDEKDLDCAIREVYEETGFDIREAGLVKDENDVKFIEITMREQHMRLYIFRGVPTDTQFAPRTRKEISKIEWYKLSELPTLKKNKQHDVANANKFYMVAPFLYPLKKWIAQQRKLDARGHGVSMMQTEGETSMDEAYYTNGRFTPKQEPLQTVSSDLPEVTPSEDVSSHLKRLLNIGGTGAPSAVTADSSKSNALLSLLRSGSNGVAENGFGMTSQAAPALTSRMAPQHISPPDQFHNPSQPFPFSNQLAYSGPGAHPLPRQPQQGPSPAHPFPFNAGFPDVRQTTQGQQLDRSFPPMAALPPLSGYRDMVGHGQPVPSLSNQFKPFPPMQSSDSSYPPSQQHVPPPYQQTGDPQFAQPTPSLRAQGPRVPPASQLPPPKLTSHSLALLNFFRSETAATSKAVDRTVSPVPGPGPSAPRKPSQHQDHLLSLLKGSSAGLPTTPAAAELSAQPAPSVPMQILQRPASAKPADKKTRREDEAITSATVSGPLKTPEFDRIRKPGKKANGTPRKTEDRRVSASPIKILPRPPSAKRDSPSLDQPISQSPSQPPPQPPLEKVKSPEPPKQFQPQILRRSDKLDLNAILPSRTTAVQELSQSRQSRPDGVDEKVAISREKVTQPIYDRRPNQTTAQKEALLSLFGKSTVVPEPPSTARSSVSANVNVAASPALSSGFPTAVSSFGSPSESDARTPGPNRVTSPDNKAFLLGFLEGVAQGKR